MRFGPYELKERLAVGGMAEVFLAVRGGAEGFRRQVVLKRILPQYATDPDFQTLFADETRLGGLLHHPNIVQMFDYDRVDGVAYLAMEYVPGHDLAFTMRAGPPLPLPVSLHIALEVLAGLGYAHDLSEAGRPVRVVHRDISPGNILLSWTGEVKIADFGVARAEIAAHRTRGGELKGKIPYLSPEQVLAKTPDRRSDLFSLGIVLYQMVTGTRPFEGDGEIDVMQKISSGQVMPPTRISPFTPPELDPVIMRALALEPSERFQSAQQMAAALRDAAEAAGIFPSAEALRAHLAQFPREGQGHTGDEAPTTPAGGNLLVGVPDRTPSGPKATTAIADAETVVDRKSSTPAPVVVPPSTPSAPVLSAAMKGAADGAVTTPRPFAGAPDPAATSPLPSAAAVPPPRRRAAPWLAALGAAALATSGLALWLASRDGGERAGDRPETPAAVVPSEAVVVMRMGDQQEAWFLENLLEPALARHGATTRIVRFGDVDDLPAVLRGAGKVDLVKVPLSMARVLVEAGLVRSLSRLAVELDLPGGVSDLTAGFDPTAMALCEYPTIVGRELFFLPRKTEVRFLVTWTPGVRVALAAFPALRASLEADLRRLSGHGLPAGFVLEDDPEQWDSYDMLALAYAMSRTPDAQGRTMPRVARRTHAYWGTVGTVLDMLRTLGQDEPVVEANRAMADFMAWEILYRELGLYHPAVYRSDSVMSGRGLYEAMQSGEVHVTTTHALGVRLLAGNPAEGVRGYLPGGADLGLATLPRGVSLELDATGTPAREGTRRGFVDGWLWAIPSSAPSTARSLALLRELTSRESSAREARAFSIGTVRTDVTLTGDALEARLIEVVRRQQALDGGVIVPRPGDAAEIATLRDRVTRPWRQLVVARTPGEGAIDQQEIATRLREILR